MSAESLRRKGGNRMMGQVVRPQTVSEKTLMESVAGLINEVGLVAQPYTTSEEKQNSIAWTKFEVIKNTDLKLGTDFSGGEGNEHPPPLLLTLGYHSGVQMWVIPLSGEAQEVLSWRRPSVRLFQLLPSPVSSGDDPTNDQFQAARPIVATVEGSNSPSCPNHLTFTSLRNGEVLKTTKFIHPVCDLLANSNAVVVSFLDKILVLDPHKFEIRTTIASPCSNSQTPAINPIALGSSWLATADRKLQPSFQSAGGVETAGPPSYTATVLYAAKSLSKGLKGLSETVANSITGHRIPLNSAEYAQSTVSEPGVVTVLNLDELKPGEFSLNDLFCSASNAISHSSVVAHFTAHPDHPVQAFSFDPSGLLLVTADKDGHDFHVFRIHPHPLGSSMAAVHHLYVLHRGDTGAKVQDISFAPDSRWVAVSTMRGTTHIFPITPYGGAISVRTHTSHRVVNRLSRFHRTAGLDDAPTSGRNSPVLAFNPGPSAGNPMSSPKPSYDLLHLGSPYPNPRLPPFPHPCVVLPLAQLRHSVNNSSSPRSSPPIAKSKGIFPSEERIHVVASFQMPRGWLVSSPLIVPHCDKRKRSPMDAVFVMTCHGNLIEYCLEPKPSAGVPKDKISDDAPIDLSVHARAQWNFTKPSFTKDLQPPLGANNVIIQTERSIPTSMNSNNCNSNTSDTHKSLGDPHAPSTDGDESPDERWLSQVEITTHSGPHRRLWMGPQFTFKVFNPATTSSGSQGGMVDVETVEVNVTNRPAKSNPVNMPVSSSLLPVVIEGSSGSSLEQSPRLDSYCDDKSSVTTDSQIKENLADAMMENCAMSSRDIGGCQSLGSCEDISSCSFDSTGQHSVDVPTTPSYSIEANLPFPD